MVAPQKIIELVEDFTENKHDYTNPDMFDEENTKVKFLNPFFEELGWNVRNEGLSARFREVVFEDSIKVGSKTKAPDYSFRLGGERIFFVEAKKPSQDISSNKEHAFQVRRYGWSAKLPLCILTDFEELSIYDTTIKPDKNQNASIGRIKYYKYTDYVEKWDEIYNIFSKEAVLSGKFDNYANNVKHDKKGTTEVDDEFLKEIEHWRLLLARNIALRNQDLSIEELNYAVQLTIDRIIFLRIAEDRGIERYGQLEKLLQKENIYAEFAKICKKADEKYNSGLFHFNPYDKEDFTTDTYTLDLTIDDAVFKEIFKNLYYPNSPYEFSLISTEILGKIYEQFLGQVIRLTPGHKAKVEEKPEVKKAGGVYYTPQYIVDYIVENTIGEKIKDKTPNQISKLKVIDPACGSGSFLIRAYQYLLDYHLDYYSNMTKPPKDVIYEDKKGLKHLTVREKKRILKNNIYGVDLDTLAVEVTKLSLLLKVLEDQNKDLLESQQKLFHERVLPNLSSNIKNGNSLIGTDILDQQELSMDELRQVKPFDWITEFPKIFEEGGFDCVIGNPPYVGEKGNKENFRNIKKTEWGSKYYYTKMDLFYYFFHKSIDISKDDGLISFITTNYFLTADGAIKLRNDFKNRTDVIKIINFNELQIFENAKGQHNCITFLDKNRKNHLSKLYSIKMKGSLSKNKFQNILDKLENVYFVTVEQNKLYQGKDNFIFLEGVDSADNNSESLINTILKKMESGIPLKKIANINAGADITISKITKKHIDTFGSNYIKGEGVFVLTKDELKQKDFPSNESEIIKPFIKNSDIDSFVIKKFDKYLIYTNTETDIKKYPSIEEHLKKFKKIMVDQIKRYGESIPWYMIHRPREERIYLEPRIILPYRSKRNIFAYSENPLYASRDVFFILSSDTQYDLKYLLALLNSKIYYIWLYYRGKKKGEILELYSTPVGNIPIPQIPASKQEPFIKLAEKMMNLKQKYYTLNTPTERKLLQQQIELTDKKINELVYELYGLTPDEIEIIESNL